MKVCFVGLGSIGSRHIRNLLKVAAKRGLTLQLDALRSSRKPLPDDIAAMLSKIYYSVGETPEGYDVVYITNPTSLHYDTIHDMLPKTRHMFIEKPVFSRSDLKYESLPWKPDGVYYVACPLRFHSVIKYLKDFIQGENIYAARCICSSYLPEWKPDIDYWQSYSAQVKLGGGVRRDLIHEWDYLQYLFGAPLGVFQQYGKYSNLEINSEDIAVYIANYPDKLISLHLDYFGRISRRELELFTEDNVIIGDLIKKQVTLLKSEEIVSLPQERDDMQQAEVEYFLDIIEGKHKNHNDVAAAVSTLKIAMGMDN